MLVHFKRKSNDIRNVCGLCFNNNKFLWCFWDNLGWVIGKLLRYSCVLYWQSSAASQASTSKQKTDCKSFSESLQTKKNSSFWSIFYTSSKFCCVVFVDKLNTENKTDWQYGDKHINKRTWIISMTQDIAHFLLLVAAHLIVVMSKGGYSPAGL